MSDKTRKPLEEQFRTLDDPPFLTPIGPGYLTALEHETRRSAGYWRTEERRPNVWRRFWARVLLGWRWEQYR